MGTRVLLFSSLLLLALPWLGYRYIDEMKDFLLQGQQDAQLLAAQALATVLHGRAELFYPMDQPAAAAFEIDVLYVFPLPGAIEIDGYTEDWGDLQQHARGFSQDHVVFQDENNSTQDVDFSLLLGDYQQYLYALVRVTDRHIVYRHPRYKRLDHGDHIRLELGLSDGENERLILITDGEGQVSVYEMAPNWSEPVSGKPVHAVYGFWREHREGYYLEFRLPKAWLGEQLRLTISVANVDDGVKRQIESIVSTRAREGSAKTNVLITRSPELDRIIQGLGSADAAICVVDRFRRVRGVFGGDDESTQCAQTDTVSSELVDQALQGRQSVRHYVNSTGETIIAAAYPVYVDDQVLGAVMVEKNSRRILGLQRESLVEIAIATFVVFLIAIFGLLLFAAWLAYRIRRLQKEVSKAIDADGRIVAEHINTDQHAADEIGQLSRDFSSLLLRLKSYTGFLETVPRTLRHEILNPLNTISMSLQQLEQGALADSLLVSAHKATRQLETIVHGLTEAAHIEDALKHDKHERLDLAALVTEYVANSKLKHGNYRFTYQGPASGVFVSGSDLRLTQLLDKLKDNALDFSGDETSVEFELVRHQRRVELSVINEGPPIPEEVLHALFTGMISRRTRRDNKPHLGIGLYVASRIAEQHRGELKIQNLRDNKGVIATLLLAGQD